MSALQVAELRAALLLIESLRSPTHGPPALILCYFTMSTELAAELASLAGLGWPVLSLSNLTWPDHVHITTPLPPLFHLSLDHVLTTPLLYKLISAVTRIDYMLKVLGIDLDAPLGDDVQLPWSATYVRNISLRRLVNHYAMLGEDMRWSCGDLESFIQTSHVSCMAPHLISSRQHPVALTHTVTNATVARTSAQKS